MKRQVFLISLALVIVTATTACSSQAVTSEPVKPISPPVPQVAKQVQQEVLKNKFTAIPDTAQIIGVAPSRSANRSDGNQAKELFVMDDDGNNIIQITHDGDMYNHFAVSPNRKMIAATRWQSDTNGNGTIDEFDKKTLWLLDLENGKDWPLLPDWDTGYGGVDWSPDGHFIYFSSWHDKFSDIYRISYDGKDLQNITKDIKLDLPFAADKASAPKWVSDTGVSHDGEWICFLFTRIGVNKGVIAVCRTDGTDARIITDGGELKAGKYGPFSAGDFDPEFSPDGKYVVFERATGAATNFMGVASGDVMTVKVDGTELKNLSPAANMSTLGIPDWSVDNRIIISEWNKRDMYAGPAMINADGNGFHRLEKARSITWVRWIPQK